MSLPLANVVKGQLTQTLLSVLLEGAGYRITRLGIEEVFYELRLLDSADYLALKLPPTLRSLPDFVVSTKDMKEAHLVEVKFRRRFSMEVAKELHKELSRQRETWPSSMAIIMISEAEYTDMRFHQDYMRAVFPGEESKLLPSPEQERQNTQGVQSPATTVWKGLPTLLKAFPRLVPSELSSQMDSLTSILKSLSVLSS